MDYIDEFAGKVMSATESSGGSGESETLYFIGANVPLTIKRKLESEAKEEGRSVVRQIRHILTERYKEEEKQEK